ncbi:MAG: M48 family metallopeptidase [Bdellovibrionota bacterium]
MQQLSIHFLFERLFSFAYNKSYFPSEIHLPAISKTYFVEYQKKADVFRWEKKGSHLIIYGSHRRRTLIRKQIFQALKTDCQMAFTPRLREMSQQYNLSFRNVRYKTQKTLWGSCSELKNLNFNIRLLFLPTPLVEYVFLHELCHTRHLDHSKRFWSLVQQHDPHYKIQEKKLESASEYLPQWAKL